MDLEGIMLNEKVRERQILYDFTYMWDLKTKQMNKHKIEKMRLIYTENKLVMAAKGKGVGEISETGEGD